MEAHVTTGDITTIGYGICYWGIPRCSARRALAVALAMQRCRDGGGDDGGGEKGEKAFPAAALARSLGVSPEPSGGHWPDRVVCDEVRSVVAQYVVRLGPLGHSTHLLEYIVSRLSFGTCTNVCTKRAQKGNERSSDDTKAARLRPYSASWARVLVSPESGSAALPRELLLCGFALSDGDGAGGTRRKPSSNGRGSSLRRSASSSLSMSLGSFLPFTTTIASPGLTPRSRAAPVASSTTNLLPDLPNWMPRDT
mmetsp:Transcript_105637/g.305297  ORF Transcript_105637/g.305297 Transcript_105637/m.305297 type:complete len:253 (+) Transcript_105637:1388-2146(+)